MQEAEAVMRIRHNLKLDEPNDFDLVTQDAILKVWDQFSQATFLALVVISSIALMVGGIGVMAIMMISVTERTREIGVRKALGARRREILWQFLIEAAFLTSVGGAPRDHLRQRHRPGGALGLGLPDLAAVVVVRARHRLLRERRHLLRPLPRHQGVPVGSDRGVEIRISCQLPASSSSFPLPASAPRWDGIASCSNGCCHSGGLHASLALSELAGVTAAGLPQAGRVAEIVRYAGGVRCSDLPHGLAASRPAPAGGYLVPRTSPKGPDGQRSDFRRFLLHSLGSLNEVEYHLLLARDLGFLPSAEHRPALGTS